MRNFCLFFSAVVLVCGLAAQTQAQDWTRFRGPNGTGVSEATTIPTKWEANDFNWRVTVPGEGHSHPVIWGDRLFLTSSTDKGNLRWVLCYHTKDGQLLWKKSYPLDSHRKHNLNSFASATPAVDERQVYVAFSDPENYVLVALDHQGNEQWRYRVGPYQSQHGNGTSPIVYEDWVILSNEQDGASSLVAVDAATGEKVWETTRRVDRVSYSTPMVYTQPDGTDLLIFNSSAHGVSAVKAKTGELVWEAPLFNKRSCSSPVLAGDALIGTCGSGGGGNYLIAIRPGGEGDVSATHLKYKLAKSSMIPYVPTPITNGKLMFLWTSKGIVSCVNTENGQVVWQQRVPGTVWASPIRVRDRLYTVTAEGDCVVIAADDEFKELARNPLLEGSHSTPAVSDGVMYIRTFGHLMSIGGE